MGTHIAAADRHPTRTSPHVDDLTALLHSARDGDGNAARRAAEYIYDYLHRMARRQMASERRDHTLQATALAHEAWLEMIHLEDARWETRACFYSMAAQVMRRFLVDHARHKHTIKAGNRWTRVPFDYRIESLAQQPLSPETYVDLDASLKQLAGIAPRAHQVVELRFFAGMTIADVALTLGVSDVTIEKDFRFARAWLRQKLGWRPEA